MMTYTAWVTVGRLTLPGTDPYGLRKLFSLAVLMTGHTLAGFIFALLQRSRLKNHQRLIEGLKKKTHTQ
ncbi:hypothetical protein GCM10023183_24730 [Nibribacter koreensis]|uniref:Potassium channel domain-containing protein n=1 Tax=Nibribacter koreensis TaxID=1084519 RepID=A0ABP8FPG7_9BACT